MPTLNNRFLRLPEVVRKTGLSRSELYRRVKVQKFPKSIRIGARMVAWLESDVDGWIADCVKHERSNVANSFD